MNTVAFPNCKRLVNKWEFLSNLKFGSITDTICSYVYAHQTFTYKWL